MIQKDDFIKLFLIHNANRYNDPQDCLEDAEEYGDLLHESGYFDINTQVVPNDFLIDLTNIENAIKSLKK